MFFLANMRSWRSAGSGCRVRRMLLALGVGNDVPNTIARRKTMTTTTMKITTMTTSTATTTTTITTTTTTTTTTASDRSGGVTERRVHRGQETGAIEFASDGRIEAYSVACAIHRHHASSITSPALGTPSNYTTWMVPCRAASADSYDDPCSSSPTSAWMLTKPSAQRITTIPEHRFRNLYTTLARRKSVEKRSVHRFPHVRTPIVGPSVSSRSRGGFLPKFGVLSRRTRTFFKFS